MQRVEQTWAGIDAGKGHHHMVVIDSEGHRLLSRRVSNDESDLAAAIAAILTRAETVTWAIDLGDRPGRRPGRTGHHTPARTRSAGPLPAGRGSQPHCRRLPR